MDEDIKKVLLTKEEIDARVKEMGKECDIQYAARHFEWFVFTVLCS